jgi:3-hydroxy-9,10-secoandrosta-1,3,5(10)-triene-9,17-dione monooxygenase reductase component
MRALVRIGGHVKTVAGRGAIGYNFCIMQISDELKHSIGKALGRVPSGVFILTARHNDQSSAMMASWVQQASFHPPTVSIAIAKDRPIAQLIRESKQCVLSVVPENDTSLMKRYARGIKPGEDPFSGVQTIETTIHVPALAAALAYLELRVIHACDFGGDHELFIAEVTNGKLLREGASFTHLRGNGFHY